MKPNYDIRLKRLFDDDDDDEERIIDISFLSPEKQAEIHASLAEKEDDLFDDDDDLPWPDDFDPDDGDDTPPNDTEEETYLPSAFKNRLASLERKGSLFGGVDEDDEKWLRYAKALNSVKKRSRNAAEIDDKALYKTIKRRCRELHLPEYFARAIVPIIVAYARGKQVKPIILCGPPGCGKSHSAALVAELMQLPLVRISAPRAEYAHGYQGEGKSFKNPDAGEFIRGMAEQGAVNCLFFVDEIDKAAHKPETRVSQQDELLNIIAEKTINDNFMEFSVDIGDAVLVFAVNDIDFLSRPFIDRCTVIEFREAELDRLLAILTDYVAMELAPFYKGKVSCDDELLRSASRRLYGMGVTSIRQHIRLADEGFGSAYGRYLEQDSDEPAALCAKDFELFFAGAEACGKSRVIGF